MHIIIIYMRKTCDFLKLSIVFSFFTICFFHFAGIVGVQAKTVYPTETDEFLSNPGMGWMTMWKPASSDGNVPSGVTSSTYYFREYWEIIHTGDDQYEWWKIDNEIEKAMASGQQLMINIAPSGDCHSSPEWIKNDDRFTGYSYQYKDTGCVEWVADLDDPDVQNQISKFLTQMGNRYDQHPGVDSIEISFFGLWGEGHFWQACRTDRSGCDPDDYVPLPSQSTLRWLADQHYANFPNTPIIGPIGCSIEKIITKYIYETYGETRGAGIFFNCWGDYTDDSSGWNHMEDGYPTSLNCMHSGSNWDSWKKGPRKLEPCGTMLNWPKEDIPRALQWALDNHAGYIGNKHDPVPSGYHDDVRETLKRLGYRLVLKKVQHPDNVNSGQNLQVTLGFENKGVAPPYNDYYLAIQLRDSAGNPAQTFISEESIKFWLPVNEVGTITKTLYIPISSIISQGSYSLAVGITSPYDQKPKIKMAIQGRESSNWHPVSSVHVGLVDPNCKNGHRDSGECGACP
jgi:hypothetical protein